jgi:hypothetical protein
VRLGKDNQGIEALRKANKTLLKATLNNCKNITLDIDASEVIENIFKRLAHLCSDTKFNVILKAIINNNFILFEYCNLIG